MPREADEGRAHRLVVLEERGDGLLHRDSIDGGLSGIERVADADADGGGGAGRAREERAGRDAGHRGGRGGKEARRGCNFRQAHT